MAKSKPFFESVDLHINFPKLEDKIVTYWKINKTFEKSVNNRPEGNTWTFLDGPPFITGLPHYGTLLSSIPKDLYPRFWTMKGYRVRRVWGWDCHGLPAENKVERKLGIKRKKDIEQIVGIKKFVDECKRYVNQISGEWEWYVEHIARWVDFKNSYKTMDRDYMETVMWVFKQMYDKGYIYKGLRVSLFCPRCSTPISNFEVAMDSENYKDITEVSNVYKYQLKEEKDTFLLAWSTTPWNKIVTPALAVNPNLLYVKVKQGKENCILAKDTLGMLKKIPKYAVVDSFKGEKLIGKKFIPHYDFYQIDAGKRAFVVIGGDFVSADEGTGIVTLAAYGEEDLYIMQKENIQLVMHVDDEGVLTKDVPNWGGLYYLEVNKLVNEDLAKRGLLYRQDTHTHSIAHCWRCGTRLFYNPQNAWFADIQKLKPQMKSTNKKVNWYPSHFKYGRFEKSMEAAPDWCISRSRYWGSPVPVWECENCEERFVPASIADLEKKAGKKVEELHRPEIDNLIVNCEKCGGKSKRVPEVLDSWLEAGSASLAERHYPFNKKLNLKEFFPPDFIVEYTGQIRAWFYVLHVISNALFGSPAFKNVVVTGVILGTDGRKMSKNYGNYPDPKEMLQTYGGDALRLYLMRSPVMKGEDIRISEVHYKEEVKGLLLILWNIYNFFVTYANLNSWKSRKSPVANHKLHILDKWILAKTKILTSQVTSDLENYNTIAALEKVNEFVLSHLSRWYIRRSRERLGLSAENRNDKEAFYQTCYNVLTTFCRVFAPFAPFITEEIYKNLTKDESVHLSEWPTLTNLSAVERKLIDNMDTVRQVVEAVHALRKEKGIPVRQPLSEVEVTSLVASPPTELLKLGEEELNVKKINWRKGKVFKLILNTKISTTLLEEGKARELVREIQNARRKMGVKLTQRIDVSSPWIPKNKKVLKWVLGKTLTKKLDKGKFSVTVNFKHED